MGGVIGLGSHHALRPRFDYGACGGSTAARFDEQREDEETLDAGPKHSRRPAFRLSLTGHGKKLQRADS